MGCRIFLDGSLSIPLFPIPNMRLELLRGISSHAIPRRAMHPLIAATLSNVVLAACARPIPIEQKAAPAPAAAQAPVVVGRIDSRFTAREDLTTYFEFQVEHPAEQLRTGQFPHYPEAFRRNGVQAEVRAQFVVTVMGKADSSSIKILNVALDLSKADRGVNTQKAREAFAESVKTGLLRMQFRPASLKGKTVRQLVEQPFTFSLSR
jgi:hypothetical protein